MNPIDKLIELLNAYKGLSPLQCCSLVVIIVILWLTYLPPLGLMIYPPILWITLSTSFCNPTLLARLPVEQITDNPTPLKRREIFYIVLYVTGVTLQT